MFHLNVPLHCIACLFLASSGVVVAQTGAARPPVNRAPLPLPPKPTGPDNWNFTTSPGVLELDGFKDAVLVFKRNDTRVAILPPPGWNSSGTSAELVLSTPQLPGARISFRKSSLPVPKEFDPAWTENLRTILLGTIPKSAKNGKIDALQNQPVSVNGWKTFEGRCTFDLAGERYVWNYLFLRFRDENMLEAISVSREIDFQKVRSALLGILPTWQDMPTGRIVDAPPPAQPPRR